MLEKWDLLLLLIFILMTRIEMGDHFRITPRTICVIRKVRLWCGYCQICFIRVIPLDLACIERVSDCYSNFEPRHVFSGIVAF